MAELTGFPELTPYDGGWCGNDVFPDVLTEPSSACSRASARIAMGERLRAEGYRGYFELDFLADANSGEMYLGELNPRVTGACSITNVTAVAYGDMPLFLFHLLEFMDVDYEIDVDELNRRWAHPGNLDEWTQFILKQTDDAVELITEAPSSGIWRMDDDGAIGYARRDTDWHTVADESEAFYLRIAECRRLPVPGGRPRYPGHAGRFLDDDHELVDRAGSWITGHQVASSEACRRPREAPAAGRAGTVRLQDAVAADPIHGRKQRGHTGWCRSRSARSRSSSSARSGRVSSRRAGRTTATWFLREGEAARPSYATSVRMLRAHMPELVPAYERVVELAGGGDLAARMLSLYKPPPYLAACSQGVWTARRRPRARAQLRLRTVAGSRA